MSTEEISSTTVISSTSTNSTFTETSTSTSILEMDTKMATAVRACQMGDFQSVQFLLNGHVTSNELDHEGCGLMHWAAINNKSDIIELLLSHNGNIDLIGGNMRSTPLHWACYNSQLAAIVTLVKNGANATIKNLNGETPLHIASLTGNSTIIAYLLAYFPHIKDMRDNLGRSGLMLAARSSFGLFPIRIFTKFQVYLDFTDDETGETALHTTMHRQNLKGAIELILNGADEKIESKNGKTAFDMVNDKIEKCVREKVEIQRIRESGTTWERISSKWFLTQFFTATITGILMALGLGLYFLSNFWVVVAAMAVTLPMLIYGFRNKQIEHFGYLPVTYIFWMGMAELGLLIFDTDGFIHWTILMVLCAIWVISASFYWILILTDPGIIPKSDDPINNLIFEIEENGVERFCFTCWVPKTNSMHHCALCDTCVDGFDHHCPWIHKCVYRQNLRFFVLFCCTNFLFDILYMPVLMYMVATSIGNVGFTQTLDDHGVTVISLLLSIPHVIGAGTITFTQLSQISRRVTTIELIRKKRAEQESTSDRSTSPPEYNPWAHRPSMWQRIENVWNLLAFDKYDDLDDSQLEPITTTTVSRF